MEMNCVAVHNEGNCSLPHLFHGNTSHYDAMCIAYLCNFYGARNILLWIETLGMKVENARVGAIRYIVEQEELVGIVELTCDYVESII
jgi:hypothetical protein